MSSRRFQCWVWKQDGWNFFCPTLGFEGYGYETKSEAKGTASLMYDQHSQVDKTSDALVILYNRPPNHVL